MLMQHGSSKLGASRSRKAEEAQGHRLQTKVKKAKKSKGYEVKSES